MTPLELFIAEANMNAIQAEEMLMNFGDRLKSKDVYLLTLRATGDETVAQEAWTNAIRREMDRGETPEA